MTEKFQLIHSGEEYFILLEHLISEAQDSIHIMVYALLEDQTGIKIIHALKQASDRNVEIYLLVDAFGSKELSQELKTELLASGINFRKFSPYLTGNIYSAGRRMHMKLILIDGEKILIGGINISNSYNDIKGDFKGKAWLDYAVLIQDSRMAKDLEKFYAFVFDKKLNRRIYKEMRFENESCRVLINDWLYQSPSISRKLLTSINDCQEELVFMISYFLPGRRFLKQLRLASERGVRITLINSAQWDIPFMGRAIRYLYPKLLKNKISIYEWKPTMLHAKVIIFDRKMCTIGSYNLNGLSHYNSLEMNAFIQEEKFVRQLENELDQLIEDHNKVRKIERYHPTLIGNLFNWFSYKVIRMSLSLMFLLVKEEKHKRLKDLSVRKNISYVTVED